MHRNLGGRILALLLATAFVLMCSTNPAHAQTYSVIWNFTGGGDGSTPYAGVTIRGGHLFGTTYYGGPFDRGAIYELMPVGSIWSFSPVLLFSNGGANPQARVVFGPDGRLYGTTYTGGSNNFGTLFYATPPLSICKTANCSWKEHTIHSFTGSPDGNSPFYGDLVWDQQGNIFGTTESGGASNQGAVYELKPSGNSWTEEIIHSFSGTEYNAYSGVILDSNGDLFGTIASGGIYYGAVYELKYTNGSWVETPIYTFQNGSDGAFPVGGLVMDKAGNLYGSTTGGGSGGGGTIFELSPAGDSWTFQVLYNLQGDGAGPYASLTMDDAGNLYGTTYADGANGKGNIFKLTKTGNGWAYSSLHDFSAGSDGRYPIGAVTVDSDGTLYGTAALGGSQANGIVWMIQP
jgi:uncharacterized repeat protein (TIGR03803 family)